MAIDASILSQLKQMQPAGQAPRNVFEKASQDMQDERQRQSDRKTAQSLQAIRFIQGQQDRQISQTDRATRLAREAKEAGRRDIADKRATTTYGQSQKDRTDRLKRRTLTWGREDEEWQHKVASHAREGKELGIKAITDRSKGMLDSMLTYAETFGTGKGWEAYISEAYVNEQLKPFNIDSGDEQSENLLKNAWRNTRAYLGNAGQFVENPNQLGNLESVFKMHFDKAVSEGLKSTGEKGFFGGTESVFSPESLTSPGTDDYTIEEVGAAN